MNELTRARRYRQAVPHALRVVRHYRRRRRNPVALEICGVLVVRTDVIELIEAVRSRQGLRSNARYTWHNNTHLEI